MFTSIKGQDQAALQLENALSRPVNSYIFYGNRGTNIEQCARIFASRIIDNSGIKDDRIIKQIYSDVIEFEPNGVNYRIKEDVRETMLGEMSKSPIEGERKVLIVHDAHRLREDSANAMLKSIEEPPNNIIWILIAPERDLVLPTIHSRCFPIQFSSLSWELIFSELIERNINEELALYVSKNSGGRLDRALNMATRNKALLNLAIHIAKLDNQSAGDVVALAKDVTETFDEISKGLVSDNKEIIASTKKELQDSGYSEKIQKSVLTTTKNRFQAQEKRLRSELLQDFLDYYQSALLEILKSNTGLKIQISKVDDYRKKLIYNPNESLFLESLFATMAIGQ